MLSETTSSGDGAVKLWAGVESFRVRIERSAHALGAVVRTLERRRPLAGEEGEFLGLFRRFSAEESIVAEPVFGEPQTFFWVRTAYQLTAACLSGADLSPMARAYADAIGGGDPRAALVRHLDQFKLFLLGAAVLRGADCELDRPLRTVLPAAIPGTRWSLTGSEEVEVIGLGGRMLRTRAGGLCRELALEEPGPHGDRHVELRRCPVARHRDLELRLQPYALVVPGWSACKPLLEAGLGYQEENVDSVRRALETLDRYLPDVFDDFAGGVRLIALKPRLSGGYTNSTSSEFPGAFTAGVVTNPVAFAEAFIHELHHNRLFCLEEGGAFFEPGGERASYYSPWREDPRPAPGLLHALYVHVPVCRYWLRLYADAGLRGADREFAGQRLLMIPRQQRVAIAILERHVAFTPHGRRILDGIKATVEDLGRQIERTDLPPDAPALSVAEDGSYEPRVSEVDGRPLSVRELLAERVALRDKGHHVESLAI